MIKRLLSKKANLFGKSVPVFVIVMIALIGFASATAVTVYVVNSLTLTVGVKEAFVVQYAVLGDGGTYDGVTTCENYQEAWFTSDSQSIPTGGFYPMEARRVCVKIQNLGEVAIPYTIEAKVTGDNPNGDCASAFGLPLTVTGKNAAPQGLTYDGATVQIAANAKPIEGCTVVISVGRG